MPENIKDSIIIADDHPMIRMGVKFVIQEHFNMDIFEASNGNELFDLVKKSTPSLVLLDINMPNTDSQGILNNLLTLDAEINILMFSVNKEEIYGKSYLKLGARGYLQKDAPTDELVRAIKCVLSGNVYMRKEMQSFYLGKGSGVSDSNHYSILSHKELEILHYLNKGDSVMNIAKVMNLSSSTIGTHKAKIFFKLHVENVLELREITNLYPLN